MFIRCDKNRKLCHKVLLYFVIACGFLFPNAIDSSSQFESSPLNIIVDTKMGPNGLKNPQLLRNFWGGVSYDAIYSGTVQDEFEFAGGGINTFDGISWESYTVRNTESSYGLQDGLSNDSIISLAIDGNNIKWFGTLFGGVNSFDGENWRNYTPDNTGIRGTVTSLSEITLTDQNASWIPNQFKGLILRFLGKNFLIDLNTENTLTISTVDVKFPNLIDVWGKAGDPYLIINGLGSDNIKAILVDSKGNKWFGTGGFISIGAPHEIEGGVSIYDGVSWKNFTVGNTDGGLLSNNVMCLAEDKEGIIWIGTGPNMHYFIPFDGGGISKYDTGTRAFKSFRQLSWANTITSIGIDLLGNRWFTTLDMAGVNSYSPLAGGILELPANGDPDNPYDWIMFNTLDGLASNTVFSVTVDKDGNKWFGTAQGVSMLDDKGTVDKSDDIWTNYTSDHQKGRYTGGGNSGLADNFVYKVIQDSKGKMWFGTFRGLTMFDGKSWETYTTNEGLVNNKVSSINFDSSGKMWIGTGDYISFTGGKRTLDLIKNANDRRNKQVIKYVSFQNVFSDNPGSRPWGWDWATFVYTKKFYETGDPNDLYWERIDRALDRIVYELGLIPVFRLCYTPSVIASDPDKIVFYTGANISPPNDYKKYSELISGTLKHFIIRYGAEEVEKWYFELWNQPDLWIYWGGDVNDYNKLYDYTVEAAKKVEEEYKINIKIGGPPVSTFPYTSPAFMQNYFNHIAFGTNYATGKMGTRTDFISIPHNYGYTDSVLWALRYLNDLIGEIDIKKFPNNKGSSEVGPDYSYPTTSINSYEAAWECKLVDGYTYLKDTLGSQFEIDYVLYGGGIMAPFPILGSFNDYLSITASVGNAVVLKRPIINAFEALSYLGKKRISMEGVNFGDPIHGIASKDDDGTIAVLLYHLNEADRLSSDPSFNPINLTVRNIPNMKYRMKNFKIDRMHSNVRTKWLEMGSPNNPNPEQVAYLQEHDGLELAEPESIQIVQDKTFTKRILLQYNSVALILLQPVIK